MCMRAGHQAIAVPLAETVAWAGLVFTPLPVWVSIAGAGLVWYSSDWPDLDHPPASINRDFGPLSETVGVIVRFVSWRVYLLGLGKADSKKLRDYRDAKRTTQRRALPLFPRIRRTISDKLRVTGDCHREFTHSVEGCALFGTVIASVSLLLPVVRDYYLWWGVCVFIGCVSHLFADSLTPSGVPWSVTVNLLRGKGAWARQRLGKAGLFRTDSADEAGFMFMAIWPLAILLGLTYTGLLIPLFHFITGY